MAGLWLLRHGSLPPNPERRFVGARDIALTAAGREQIRQAARALLRECGAANGLPPFGAAATGQGDDGIAQVGHCLFPLVHAFHFHELGKSGVMPSLLHHEAGNDARHLSPCPECRIGHSGHQSHISRTINQANLPLPQQSAQLTGCIEINGIYLCARSTIYAYGIYLVHHLVTSFFRYRHKGT